MEKENAVKLLEKKGFTVVYESGVPIVIYEGGVRGDAKNRQQPSKAVYTQLKENEDGQLSLL